MNNFNGLPPHLAAKAQALVERREAESLNVHFINERGEKDRYSFATIENRDKFIASLKKANLVIL